MKFDLARLQDASMAQLAQALIERLGPLADGSPAVRECLSIAFQLDERVRARELPPSE